MFHLLIIKLTCMPTEKTSYGDLSHIFKKIKFLSQFLAKMPNISEIWHLQTY